MFYSSIESTSDKQPTADQSTQVEASDTLPNPSKIINLLLLHSISRLPYIHHKSVSLIVYLSFASLSSMTGQTNNKKLITWVWPTIYEYYY